MQGDFLNDSTLPKFKFDLEMAGSMPRMSKQRITRANDQNSIPKKKEDEMYYDINKEEQEPLHY